MTQKKTCYQVLIPTVSNTHRMLGPVVGERLSAGVASRMAAVGSAFPVRSLPSAAPIFKS